MHIYISQCICIETNIHDYMHLYLDKYTYFLYTQGWGGSPWHCLYICKMESNIYVYIHIYLYREVIGINLYKDRLLTNNFFGYPHGQKGIWSCFVRILSSEIADIYRDHRDNLQGLCSRNAALQYCSTGIWIGTAHFTRRWLSKKRCCTTSLEQKGYMSPETTRELVCLLNIWVKFGL